MTEERGAAGSLAILAGGTGGAARWVLAIMTCLAMLGAAAALLLVPAAGDLSGQLAGRATIQVLADDPIAQRVTLARLREALSDAPFVSAVRIVPEEELAAMAAGWLGDQPSATGLPLPALIDVDLVGERGGSVERARQLVTAIDPNARVIAHASWLRPVVRLMSGIGIVSAALAVGLLLAAASIAVIAARGALAAQRSTIDILHLVGATDQQVVRLFQQHAARDAAVGASIGGLVALIVCGAIASQFAATAGGLMGETSLGPRYLALLGIPPLVVAISVLAARVALLRALKAMP